jgi:hypothetical protein|tara:strand:+ start:111 stop:278 length:168 start_codon:yes stop_codon:yes gene_type:complete
MVAMDAKEVLKLLEKHEAECDRRYSHIEKVLDKLDIRMWGIVVLIIGAAALDKLI